MRAVAPAGPENCTRISLCKRFFERRHALGRLTRKKTIACQSAGFVEFYLVTQSRKFASACFEPIAIHRTRQGNDANNILCFKRGRLKCLRHGRKREKGISES